MDINSLSGTASPASGGVSLPVGQDAAASSAKDAVTVVQAPSAPATSAATKAPSEPTIEQVQSAVNELNKSFSTSGQGVQFSIDQSSKRVVVKVLDEKTHQVLRQIPSEELLALSQALDQKLGKLINQQA